MADFSMDDEQDYGEQQQQPETQPETVVEPAPAPRPTPAESVAAIRAKIDNIRGNDKLTGEKKGEQLLPLYEALTAAERLAKSQAELPADPQAIAREVQTELRNQWGNKFDSKVTAIAETVVEVFGGAEKFEAFSKNLKLDANEQVSTMSLLADLTEPAPAESKMTIEQANDAVTERLRAAWGRHADENFQLAQRAAKSIFGSLEACEEFFFARGWDESPRMQTKAFIFLSSLGKKLKPEGV